MTVLKDLEVVIRYTNETNIQNCLASVSSQQWRPTNIRVIRNVSPSFKSMQQAFGGCRYKYLLVLDADQTLLPNAIRSLYQHIKKYNRVFQVLGRVEYPWTDKLGWGCGLRNMEFYRRFCKKKFKNRLNFDDFLLALPKARLNRVICREMFVSDHFQVFNTFRRLVKRIALRKRRLRGYLEHFLKAYQKTHSELYLVGLAGMFVGITEVGNLSSIDKSNNVGMLKKDKRLFLLVTEALGIKNKAAIFPKVNFRQRKGLIWK